MGLPFSLDQPPAPGYRPRCKIAPGTASSGGLLDAAASLLGAPQSDPWADHMRVVEISQCAAPAITTCRIDLAPGESRPDVAVDDALSVELGFDDTTTAVFTGKVAALHALPRGGLRVVLADPAHALAQTRQNTSYEQRTLSDLLRLWATEAGLTPGTLDSGPSYPFLAIDEHRSVWEWIGHLARYAGLLAWVDGAGKLHCKHPGGPPTRRYRYADDVLALTHRARTPLLGEITVIGEGAAGSQGSQAWSWLAKSSDAIRASAGTGAPQRLYQPGMLRSHADIQASSTGLADTATRLRQQVDITVVGSPELGTGSVFALTDCPDGRGDGDHLALRVSHRYTKNHGYLTQIQGVML